ncbi:hypothetical protein D3C87_1282520 [compost metagenome]
MFQRSTIFAEDNAQSQDNDSFMEKLNRFNTIFPKFTSPTQEISPLFLMFFKHVVSTFIRSIPTHCRSRNNCFYLIGDLLQGFSYQIATIHPTRNEFLAPLFSPTLISNTSSRKIDYIISTLNRMVIDSFFIRIPIQIFNMSAVLM